MAGNIFQSIFFRIRLLQSRGIHRALVTIQESCSCECALDIATISFSKLPAANTSEMTLGTLPSVILYPDASTIDAISLASIVTSSLLHVLRLLGIQYNIAATLHLYSAFLSIAGLTYTVILFIFRLLFFECECITTCLIQIGFCILLMTARLCIRNLSESGQLITLVIIMMVASSFIWWLHKRYVSGCKYKSTNIDGKVYIITGSNAGNLARYVYCSQSNILLRFLSAMTVCQSDS